MGFLAWIIVGLVSGFIASRIVNKSGAGIFIDIIIGIIGGVVGGWVVGFFGFHGVTGVNLYSIVVSVIGAMVTLWVYHALARR